MPVPHDGTATTVASTGTKVVARFGIEGQSVRCARAVVKPRPGDDLVKALDLIRRADYAACPMPRTIASAVPTPIISFAIFAARMRS
jgi:hypothetical protein